MNRSRRRSNSFSSIRSLTQRGASAPSGFSSSLLAEPGHGAVEVMQIEPLGAGDVVVLHPRRAVAIRSRDEQPMQRGDEHGALDRKLERALLQQIAQDVGDAEPLPDPAEQHRSADPLGGDRQRAFASSSSAWIEQHLVGELGARGDQRGERAGGGQFVGAAEIGDHRLAHRRAVALVLDDLHVAALAGLLEAEEHGPLTTEHHGIRVVCQISSAKIVQTWHYILRKDPLPSIISMPCKREGQFTVQVG